MKRIRPATRRVRFLLLVLQLTLWGAVPIADARLDAASAHATAQVESREHGRTSFPQSHGPDCPLCHFLQTFGTPASSGPSLSPALLRTPRSHPVFRAPHAAKPIHIPLARAPPARS